MKNILTVLLHCLLVSYAMACCPDYKTDFYNNISYPNFGVLIYNSFQLLELKCPKWAQKPKLKNTSC